MEKLTMLQKMKTEHGSEILIFFRSGDNYEAYYEDAHRVSDILGIELVVTDSVPTISVTRDDTDKLIDAGYGVTLSMVMDKDGNYIPTLVEEDESLHLYDDE